MRIKINLYLAFHSVIKIYLNVCRFPKKPLNNLIYTPQNYLLRLLIDTGPLQVLELGLGHVFPHLLELIDLLRSHLPGAILLLLAGHLDQPGEKRAVLDQRLPLVRLPVEVLERALRSARLSTQQHHHRVRLCRYEAQQEHVPASAVVALQNGLAQRPVLVQRHLLALGSNQMVDNVRARGQATAVAEPFLGRVAHEHTGRVVNATVGAGVLRHVDHLVCAREIN